MNKVAPKIVWLKYYRQKSDLFFHLFYSFLSNSKAATCPFFCVLCIFPYSFLHSPIYVWTGAARTSSFYSFSLQILLFWFNSAIPSRSNDCISLLRFWASIYCTSSCGRHVTFWPPFAYELVNFCSQVSSTSYRFSQDMVSFLVINFNCFEFLDLSAQFQEGVLTLFCFVLSCGCLRGYGLSILY